MTNNLGGIENSGLLKDYYGTDNTMSYQQEGDKLSAALQRRRQKLAAHKIGLVPDADPDPDYPDRGE